MRFRRILLTLAALLALGATASMLLLRSSWLREQVRGGIILELERSTGGTATLGAFAFDWTDLRATVSGLTLRGAEPPGAPPLLHVAEVQAGLKIVSFWKRDVDLQSLTIHRPQVHLIVNPDGSTNMPHPKQRGQGDPLAKILDLAIGRFAIEGGLFTVSGQGTPFSARGENFRAQLRYDGGLAQYAGTVAVKPLVAGGLTGDLDTNLVIRKNRIEFHGLRAAMEKSSLQASGVVEDLQSPRVSGEFQAQLDAAQMARLIRLGGIEQGRLEFTGKAQWHKEGGPSATATFHARDLSIHQGRVRVPQIQATGSIEASAERIVIRRLAAGLLGGRFAGNAEIISLSRYRAEGTFDGLAVSRALEAASVRRAPWDGIASGPVQVEGGFRDADHTVTGRLSISPLAGAAPLEGLLDFRYGLRLGTLEAGPSYLQTAASRGEFSGSLHQSLKVHATTSDPNELLPAVSLFTDQPVETLPVQLAGGKAEFSGTVTGGGDQTHIAGDAQVGPFTAEGRRFDGFRGAIALDASQVRLTTATISQGKAQAKIAGSAALQSWKLEPDSAISGTVAVTGLDLSQVHPGSTEPTIQGTASGIARISGTYGEPKAVGAATVVSAMAWNQPVERAEGEFTWSPGAAGIRNAKIWIAGETAEVSGSFDPTGVRWQAKSAGLPIERLHAIHSARPGARGRAAFDLRGSGLYQNGAFQLTAAEGTAAVRQLALDGKMLGDVSVVGLTRGTSLELTLQSSLLNASLSGSGRVRLEPGYAASAEVQVSKLSLAFVRDWLAPPEKDSFRFDGSAAGRVSVQGPAVDPARWTATVELSELGVFPLAANAGRFTIRNEGAVTASMKKGVLQIGAARFSGPSTAFDVSGTVFLDPNDAPGGNTLDLRINGGIGLSVLKDLEPDLTATGSAALRVGVRGTFAKPAVEGRAEVRQASFQLAEVPTGLSNASATILFSGGRATIESLTAETGGGKISATGYLGLESGLPAFRLQVNATQVRVRYPEGTSTVLDAAVSLTGTTRSSLLSGEVTILRSGFGAQSDFSSLLSKSSGPVRTPSSRTGPLSGLQFDVRVRSGANLSFDSALARDLQADADLRLRGTPYNPVLLGRIIITQGEILFFGTRYTISQGTISFMNPVKLEPILNLDVETRVRGIDVILTFTGPVNKLNVTHRADPPLEFAEVIALLATGRAPSSDPSLLALQASQPQSINRLGAGDILGQAIANPVSSRLQRFFGVSKLKIDPKLSGVETTPQARLTLEQQISRNLTFTYITDLTRSNQQIVRVEWNVNREWSVLATREENGVFGMDFLYKKSFK